jgi:hypothetical protein
MELSSPRFKALTVSAGITFWFFVIVSTTGTFSLEILLVFITTVFLIMQILAVKVSKALDIFAIFNTKLFLGILFLTIVSIYGVLFRILKINLLRNEWKKKDSYWLLVEKHKDSEIFKQY